jgi:hypothetical protein
MWYNRVVQDLGNIPEFIVYYENELADAKFDCAIKGHLEKNIASLPGVTELRFNQLQEIEAVLNYLNIQLRKIRKKHFQKYVDGEDEVIDFETIINEVALVRNKWLGLMKGLESKNFMLGHVSRLRTAGMEDITL